MSFTGAPGTSLASSSSGSTSSKPLAKPVLASPSQMESAESRSTLDGLVSKHSFPEDLEKGLANVRKDDHEKRVKALRKELDYIASTEWQFQPADSLPGQ